MGMFWCTVSKAKAGSPPLPAFHMCLTLRPLTRRSCALVVGYVMLKQQLSFQAAHDEVERARPLISLNRGFATQLQHLGERMKQGT